MKFDEEVHAEVAANRIVWALGYVVEDQYFVPSGIVTGAAGSTRAAKFVGADGAFKDARFRCAQPGRAAHRGRVDAAEEPVRRLEGAVRPATS